MSAPDSLAVEEIDSGPANGPQQQPQLPKASSPPPPLQHARSSTAHASRRNSVDPPELVWSSISTSSSSLLTDASPSLSPTLPNAVVNHPTPLPTSSSSSAVAKTIILCEILDTQTKALMPIAKVTDNLLSNEIISSCLSLIAESAATNDVLSELLQPEGNDIKLVSALDYGEQGEEISLWMLSARVRSRRELLLGYKLMSGSDSKAILNPRDKSAMITLNVRTMLIIISENM